MALSPQNWHQRFTQQALWSRDLRTYLFGRSAIEKNQRVLEVGCGTGAILGTLPEQIQHPHGLDIDGTYLKLAANHAKGAKLTQADGHVLPYSDGCFDAVFCHFLLLWVSDPLRVLGEMVRVTRAGGVVMALAEPDYGGRVDYPEALAILGEWQSASLARQGAHPCMGRRLAGLFHKAGLRSVETGALGGQWPGHPDWKQWESEWAVLESDLKDRPEFTAKLDHLKELDRSAYQQGERVLFVPTFYAWGRVLNKNPEVP